VVKGNQLGRTIGYPTANLEISEADKIIPGDGVYAVEVVIGRPETEEGIGQGAKGKRLPAMMSIGVRPTIGGTQRTIEVNIFDFAEDIYGERVRVYVKHYLRPEVKFNGLDELKAALDKDKEDSLRLFSPKH
jgi:riboflavin kinase/FMN adenylyltransferase